MLLYSSKLFVKKHSKLSKCNFCTTSKIQKQVLLMSGGVESTTMLWYLVYEQKMRKQSNGVFPLLISYGQRNQQHELACSSITHSDDCIIRIQSMLAMNWEFRWITWTFPQWESSFVKNNVNHKVAYCMFQYRTEIWYILQYHTNFPRFYSALHLVMHLR